MANNNIWIVIKREFLTKVKKPSFVIMTILTPLLMIGFGYLVYFLKKANSETEKVVTILDKTASMQTMFKDDASYMYIYLKEGDLQQLKEKASSEKNYGLLYIKEFEKGNRDVTFFSEETPSIMFLNKIENILEDRAFDDNLKGLEIDLNKVNSAKEGINIKLENSKGQVTSKSAGVIKTFFGMIVGYLLMMFILMYGGMIMQSVIEEKKNRIVEIIVSSIEPIKLLFGKIVGTSFVGFAQIAIWLMVFLILFMAFPEFFANTSAQDIDVVVNMSDNQQLQHMVSGVVADILNLPLLKIFVSFIFFFIGGYLLYSALYASIGAAVDSEENAGQFMTPIMLLLMLGVYVGITTVTDDPNGLISVVFSHIPFTSPVNMMIRIAFGVEWWEIIVSLSILYITIFFVLWMSAKIYRVGILSYGQKVTYKDLYKWLKQK